MIIHEFCHVFGAWHSQSPKSLMRYEKRGMQRFELDDVSRTMIGIGVGLDVRAGIDGIDERTLQRIDVHYGSDVRFRGEHPVAYALYRRAAQTCAADGDVESARSDLARADEISGRFPGRFLERTLAVAKKTREWLDARDADTHR